jgi:hypothetical protein
LLLFLLLSNGFSGDEELHVACRETRTPAAHVEGELARNQAAHSKSWMQQFTNRDREPR